MTVAKYRALQKRQRDLLHSQEKYLAKFTLTKLTAAQKATLKRRAKSTFKKYNSLEEQMEKLWTKMTPTQKRLAKKKAAKARLTHKRCLAKCLAKCRL